MAHSPETNVASGMLARPLYTNRPVLAMLARFSMCRTCSGELATMRAPGPLSPLPLVAISTLCQVEKLSSCVQPCHAMVSGHLWPLDLSLAAARATSGQVVGGRAGSRPAALNASLLM